jgi:nucleotidyltransferase substrate binding protein (TIGR01987 family)
MTGQELRWRQRASHFRHALVRLVDAVELSGQRCLSDLERHGLIHVFEFTHELSWTTLKDVLASRGGVELYGPRETSREAFAQGLISDGEAWMEMVHHRNLSINRDDEATVQEIVGAVVSRYLRAFQELEAHLQAWEALKVTAPTPAQRNPQATPASHGLPAAAMAKIHQIFASFPAVERATLYGSRAMGRHRPGSDIDLTLAGAGLDVRTLAQLDGALDDLLLPWRFDLSLQSSLQSPELIDHIQRVGQLFYRRSDLADLC